MINHCERLGKSIELILSWIADSTFTVKVGDKKIGQVFYRGIGVPFFLPIEEEAETESEIRTA